MDEFPSFPIMRYFAYEHLPEKLKAVSRPLTELARDMACKGEESGNKAEVAAGLRKLLEAKDCFVRAAL